MFIRTLLAAVLLQSSTANAAFQKTDAALVSAFLKGQPVEANLFEMEKDPALQSASLGENAPWSGNFLPARTGYAANPYRGSGRYESMRFAHNIRHWNSTRYPELAERLPTLTEGEIEGLAPAEKYDLLIGAFATRQSLSAALWMKAFELATEDARGDPSPFKSIESWTGLCHGFAPVSTMLPRPRSSLVLTSVPYTVDGKPKTYSIRFFPDDLKALATVAYAHSYKTFTGSTPAEWAKPSNVPMHFSRCSGNKPARDSRGRMKDQRCLDTEPGFWHLAATHLIGKRKRAFVIDYNYNEPVNNHAISGFKVEYFNPITGKDGTLSESVVNRAEVAEQDLFAAERAEGTRSIVGVKMKISRVGFKKMEMTLVNEREDDNVTEHTFTYDLELDAQGNIIGGEWRTAEKARLKPLLGIRKRKTYPDFIWWVPEDVKPYAFVETGNDGIADLRPTRWNPAHPIPADLAAMARTAVTNHIVWGVSGKPEGKDDIYPQIPFQLLEPLMEASNRQ